MFRTRAFAAACVAAVIGAASANAGVPPANMNAPDNSGQAKALANCLRLIEDQRSIDGRGGVKSGNPAPTNCDHSVQIAPWPK